MFLKFQIFYLPILKFLLFFIFIVFFSVEIPNLYIDLRAYFSSMNIVTIAALKSLAANPNMSHFRVGLR